MVYLHSPRVFQSLIVLSWPTNRRVVSPVFRSHRRRVPSHEPERANWPSEEITTSSTKWPWPRRAFLGYP